jgi:hypothetical protein
MPTWLFQIIFFGIVAGIVIYPIALLTGWASFVDKITSAPKAPTPVDTPEEMAERVTRVREMLAKAEASRLAHHH